VASVLQRKPGVWEARVFVKPKDGEGRGRQVTKTFKGTKREVTRRIADWEREVQGASAASVGLTIARLLELWQEAKAAQWQATTVREHKHRSAAIASDLGDLRLADLDPMRVDAWVARLRRAGVGEGAIRGRVGTLRAGLTWAVSRRLVRTNAVAEANPNVRVKRRAATVDSAAVLSILDAAEAESTRAGLALRLAAATGAREAELVALAWDDLEGDRLRIGRQRHSVGGALVRDQTKTGTARTVVLDATTVEAIRVWRTEVSALVDGEVGRWMFARPGASDPPSPRWLYDVFCRSAEKVGVAVGRDAGFVFHDLRHWAGSVALRDGHDPVTVAARLGHSPDTLLRVYAQEIADGQAGVASSIEARLARLKGRRASGTSD
jgi:integrase